MGGRGGKSGFGQLGSKKSQATTVANITKTQTNTRVHNVEGETSQG